MRAKPGRSHLDVLRDVLADHHRTAPSPAEPPLPDAEPRGEGRPPLTCPLPGPGHAPEALQRPRRHGALGDADTGRPAYAMPHPAPAPPQPSRVTSTRVYTHAATPDRECRPAGRGLTATLCLEGSRLMPHLTDRPRDLKTPAPTASRATSIRRPNASAPPARAPPPLPPPATSTATPASRPSPRPTKARAWTCSSASSAATSLCRG